LANKVFCGIISEVSREKTMAKRPSLAGREVIESKPKKSRQGSGSNTKYAASSRNVAKKRYRGQGK
jgi:hypothetical protein